MNVAETSVTIDGVVCVIDSGLARIARHSLWSGLPSLQVEPVSRASCAQRAGDPTRQRAHPWVPMDLPMAAAYLRAHEAR